MTEPIEKVARADRAKSVSQPVQTGLVTTRWCHRPRPARAISHRRRQPGCGGHDHQPEARNLLEFRVGRRHRHLNGAQAGNRRDGLHHRRAAGLDPAASSTSRPTGLHMGEYFATRPGRRSSSTTTAKQAWRTARSAVLARRGRDGDPGDVFTCTAPLERAPGA